MTTYHHLHPRGFANECSIVRCETPQERRDAELLGYERLTQRRLAAHIRFVNGNLCTGQHPISLSMVRNDPEYSAAYQLGTL